VARSIRDIFDQTELTQQYEEGYSPLSSIEHSDINAFFAMTAQMDKDGTERRLEIQSDLLYRITFEMDSNTSRTFLGSAIEAFR
jgi:hypothetical protein